MTGLSDKQHSTTPRAAALLPPDNPLAEKWKVVFQQLEQQDAAGAEQNIRQLVENGVQLDIQPEGSATLVAHAAAHSEATLRLLLEEFGCDANLLSPGCKNQTPLFAARGNCVALLRSHGAEAAALDADGNSPLTAAVEKKDFQQAADLLLGGVFPWSSLNSRGRSCVQLAVSLLSGSGAEQQPFWDAFFSHCCPANPVMAKELLKATDEEGRNCMQAAAAAGCEAIAAEMLKWTEGINLIANSFVWLLLLTGDSEEAAVAEAAAPIESQAEEREAAAGEGQEGLAAAASAAAADGPAAAGVPAAAAAAGRQKPPPAETREEEAATPKQTPAKTADETKGGGTENQREEKEGKKVNGETEETGGQPAAEAALDAAGFAGWETANSPSGWKETEPEGARIGREEEAEGLAFDAENKRKQQQSAAAAARGQARGRRREGEADKEEEGEKEEEEEEEEEVREATARPTLGGHVTLSDSRREALLNSAETSDRKEESEVTSPLACELQQLKQQAVELQQEVESAERALDEAKEANSRVMMRVASLLSSQPRQEQRRQQGQQQSPAGSSDGENPPAVTQEGYEKALLQNELLESQLNTMEQRLVQLQSRREEYEQQHERKVSECREAFMEFVVQVCRNSFMRQGGKPVSEQQVKKLLQQGDEKLQQISKLRREVLSFQHQQDLNRAQTADTEKWEDGQCDPLEPMDFEHLKMENQTLNEKLVERQEEAQKLQTITRNSLQLLTHWREKLAFQTKKNAEAAAQLAAVEAELAQQREALAQLKRERAYCRQQNERIKCQADIVNSDLLAADWEATQEQLREIGLQIEHLKRRVSRVTSFVANSVRQRDRRTTRLTAEASKLLMRHLKSSPFEHGALFTSGSSVDDNSAESDLTSSRQEEPLPPPAAACPAAS
ncbi:hypothetical protein Efla_005495 [Eimeria flavescens]